MAGPMDGKTCIVTGASSGIGKETALGLAHQGATVVMLCRNPAKTEAVREEIRRASGGNGTLEVVLADLAVQAEVRRAAAEILERFPRIDVLVNNAGFVTQQRSVTADGIESQLAVNHLAPFLLTSLLGERLAASAPARVVTVSSVGHKLARIDLDDLQMERRYNGWIQYCNTKLENILFTRELARRLDGSGVTANGMHPGPVNSSFATADYPKVLRDLAGLFMLSPAKGADTLIHLASSPDVALVTGKYFVKRKVQLPSKRARNDALAERLWEASEALVAPSA